jgi:EXLDI family protein
VPNRTIYVSNEDEPVFKRAQELAGDNLSAAISSALKRYIEVEDARKAGFEEVVLKIGFGAGRKVRFHAVLLGEWFKSDGEKFIHYRVYRGPKKFALHTEQTEYFEMRDAQGNPLTGWRAWTGIGMASGGGKPAEATLDLFDTLDELRDRVPEELFETVSASVKQPGVQELDI